jgi:membrane protease YdiL (CAAX protease family)
MDRTETRSTAGKSVPSQAVDDSFPGTSQMSRLPLVAVLAVFVPYILTMLMRELMSPQARSAMASSPTLSFLVYAAWNWLVICAGYLLIRRRGVTWKDLGFTNFRFRDMGLAVVGALIGLFVVYPVATYLIHVLGLPPIRGMGYSLVSPFDIVSALAACVLLGTLAEDIIFRGYLLNMLRVRIRNTGVVGFIGVIMFALVHIRPFGWGGALFILLWTPLTVGLFLWRRSIYPSYVMHVLNNFFAYMIVPLFLR